MYSNNAPDGAMRVGDAERIDAMKQLDVHIAAGRLTVREYEERSNLVMQSKTRADIVRIMNDLPPVSGADVDQAPGPPAHQYRGTPAQRSPGDLDRPLTESEIFPPGSPGSKRRIPHAIMALSAVVWLPLSPLWAFSFIIPAVVAILLYVAHIGPQTWYPTPEQKRALERIHDENEG